jgi:hypothetical protein
VSARKGENGGDQEGMGLRRMLVETCDFEENAVYRLIEKPRLAKARGI